MPRTFRAAGIPLSVTGALLLLACASSPERPQVTEAFALTPDSVRLYYRMIGVGPRTLIAPFALYHRDALDALANEWRVVTYDPRGRGRSAAVSPAAVSLDALLTDLETIRVAVGAERPSLLGWSGAGMELFAYAVRHPSHVDRLVQLAPVGPRFDPWGVALMADRARRTDSVAAARFDSLRANGAFAGDAAGECRQAAAINNRTMLADPELAASLPDVCDSPNEHVAALGRYFGALFPSIETLDWRADIPRMDRPRLVLHGRADNMPLASAEEWVRDAPDARLVILEKSGHWPLYEQQASTVALIRAFLRGESLAQVVLPPGEVTLVPER